MQKNETFEFISNDVETIQTDLDQGIELIYEIIDQVEFFHVCISHQKLILAHEVAHNRNEITGEAQAGKFKVLTSLTISQALENGILAAEDWSYSSEKADSFLQQYKP